MNTKRNTTSPTNSLSARFRRRIGRAPLALLALVALALAVPVDEANGQGMIVFNNGVNTVRTHCYAPLTGNPTLMQNGNGTNDLPVGTTDWTGWTRIGAAGNNVQYGGNTTFAALLAAPGLNAAETSLQPATAGGITSFHTGSAGGIVYGTTATFNNLTPDSTAGATVEMVAWDNCSGLYSTWALAQAAWQAGTIAAGKSPIMNLTATIGGPNTAPPNLPTTLRSFNLFLLGSLPIVATLPATAVTATNATLNGTVNPNGYSTAAWFQWGTTTSYGNLTPATDMGSGTNVLPLAVPLGGLTPGVTYHYCVAATNGPDVVYGSDQSFITSTAPLPEVSTLSATAVTTTNAMLNATVNPNGYPTAAWFQWGTTTNYGNLTAATGMGSGTNDLPLSVPLAGLSPGVIYHFRIAATNSLEVAYGADQSFTTATLPLPAVYTLPATAVTTTNATLNGTVDPNGYRTAAWFEWGITTSYGNLTTVTAMGSGTSALPLSAPLAGLVPGVIYHFRIAATNSPEAAYGGDQSFTTVGWVPGVVTNCTEAALRAAIAGGGKVTFACDGTISLANTITIPNSSWLMLDATGHQVTISGGNAVRVFEVSANATLALASLTIANGVVCPADNGMDGAGGAIYNNGTAILDLCRFTGNFASGAPGSESGNFFGGGGFGGAIYNAGTLVVKRTAFSWNLVSGGAGASLWPGPGGDGKGGAIYNRGALWLESSTLQNNSANGGAGGRSYDGHPWMDVASDGGTGAPGGVGAGGALYNTGSATAVNSTFDEDSGRGGGGGAGGTGGTGVHANGNGGAGGPGGYGFGAVYDAGGDLRLTNCTLAFNWASGGGGGAGGAGGGSGTPYPGNPGPYGPSGSGAGGGIKSSGGFLINTLLATNSSNCSGSVTDGGHNLSSDGTCSFTTIGSMDNTDPKLGPLANNRGPTLTMALLPGSPAIDAGNTSLAPATDQRGFPRPAGLAADIGAFEYGSVMPTLAVSRSGATGLNILGSGNAGQSCRLLTSPDLSSWVPIATNQIGSDGTILFYDTCAPGSACRFYRLVMP